MAGLFHVRYIYIFDDIFMFKDCVLCYSVSPLPITLSGIDVLGPGCTWLQHNLVGRCVWFQPVAVTPRNQLECIVIANMVSLLVSTQSLAHGFSMCMISEVFTTSVTSLLSTLCIRWFKMVLDHLNTRCCFYGKDTFNTHSTPLYRPRAEIITTIKSNFGTFNYGSKMTYSAPPRLRDI